MASDSSHPPPDAPSPARTRSLLAPLAVAGVVVLVDQLTKIWAVATLPGRTVHVVGNVLQLHIIRNPGSAFSFATGFTPVLAILAAAMVVFIVRTTRRTADPLMAFALALVLGGALGNLVDRCLRSPGFLRGEVVDFIKLPHWPTFNVADSAITLAVVVIFAHELRR